MFKSKNGITLKAVSQLRHISSDMCKKKKKKTKGTQNKVLRQCTTF